jgi:hypothetical protein
VVLVGLTLARQGDRFEKLADAAWADASVNGGGSEQTVGRC